MPFARIDQSIRESTRLYYRLEGRAGQPVLMLSHSLGCDHGMWDPQMPALLRHFQVLRYDTRGHGASDVTRADAYSVAQLSRDALALADALGIAEFDFCGLSLGGMTGMRIAAETRGRLRRLVLANTSAKFPDPGPMEARRQTVLANGMAAVSEAVMDRFFRKAVRESGNPYAATVGQVLLATDPIGYAAACGAVRDLDNRELLKSIDVPVLIISSEIDQSTPWKGHGDFLAEHIPHAETVLFETAHLSNIEAPDEFNGALLRFLVK